MAAKALSNQMNRTVLVNRKKLIETLVINRTKHVIDYNDAMQGYKAIALAAIHEAFQNMGDKLKTRREALEEKIGNFSAETASEYPDYFVILEAVKVPLKVPISYADAYDAAIDMATFDTRDELELSGAEFQCFCRDVWDWTYEFTSTKAFYSNQ